VSDRIGVKRAIVAGAVGSRRRRSSSIVVPCSGTLRFRIILGFAAGTSFRIEEPTAGKLE
jgi:hypothetical protein